MQVDLLAIGQVIHGQLIAGKGAYGVLAGIGTGNRALRGGVGD